MRLWGRRWVAAAMATGAMVVGLGQATSSQSLSAATLAVHRSGIIPFTPMGLDTSNVVVPFSFIPPGFPLTGIDVQVGFINDTSAPVTVQSYHGAYVASAVVTVRPGQAFTDFMPMQELAATLTVGLNTGASVTWTAFAPTISRSIGSRPFLPWLRGVRPIQAAPNSSWEVESIPQGLPRSVGVSVSPSLLQVLAPCESIGMPTPVPGVSLHCITGASQSGVTVGASVQAPATLPADWTPGSQQVLGATVETGVQPSEGVQILSYAARTSGSDEAGIQQARAGARLTETNSWLVAVAVPFRVPSPPSHIPVVTPPAPQPAAIDLTCGAGGATADIWGQDLAGSTVRFAGVSSGMVQMISNTEAQVQVPHGIKGTGPIAVVGPGGQAVSIPGVTWDPQCPTDTVLDSVSLTSAGGVRVQVSADASETPVAVLHDGQTVAVLSATLEHPAVVTLLGVPAAGRWQAVFDGSAHLQASQSRVITIG